MKKAWNLVDYQVYSLATPDDLNGTNMNICTYVTPVALQPKTYLVAVYKNTRTAANLRKYKRAVLQILTVEQAKYLNRFGRKSGFVSNKLRGLESQLDVTGSGIKYLTNSAAIIELDVLDYTITGFDHDLVTFAVTAQRTLRVDCELLTTSYLLARKLIRA